MQTPIEMAVEALSCRECGNYWGYSQIVYEMEAMGLASSQIRRLLAKAAVLARNAEDHHIGDPLIGNR